jgi:hypothetical protein
MRGRVNSYIGFAFVGAFSCLIGMVVVRAINALPQGIPPGSF